MLRTRHVLPRSVPSLLSIRSTTSSGGIASQSTAPKTRNTISLRKGYHSTSWVQRAPKVPQYVAPPTYSQQRKKGVPFGKRKLHGREHQLFMQAAVGLALFTGFVMSPFLGKKIAQDEEFREQVPGFLVNIVPKPTDVVTKEEFYDNMIAMHKELHQRAIKGEFAPEKLAEMNWEEEGRRYHAESDSAVVKSGGQSGTVGSALEDWKSEFEPFGDEDDEDDEDDDGNEDEDDGRKDSDEQTEESKGTKKQTEES